MTIKLKNLHIYIFLLLLSCSLTHCKCNSNAGKSKSEKDQKIEKEKDQKKKNRKRQRQKQQDQDTDYFEGMEDFEDEGFEDQGQQYGRQARKRLREAQREKKKHQAKAAEVGKSPMSEQEKREQLAKLVKEQEDLEKKAEAVLKQLLEEEPDSPAQQAFKSLPSYFNKKLERAKNNPNQVDSIIDGVEDIRDSLQILEKLLEDMDPFVTALFPVPVQEMLGSFDTNSEFERGHDPEDWDDQPIATNKLSESEQRFYKRIVDKYPLAKQDAGLFVYKAALEETQRFLEAATVQLALLYNIQKQHELQEK